MAAAADTKNQKSPYLNNGLTDHSEICHGGAYWHVDACLTYWQLNIRPFKNPTWCTAAVLTIINQACSECKHVLANILRSLFVARTPSEEARSPGSRSNVENAPRHPPVSGQQRAQTPPSRPFALCRHITDGRKLVTRVRVMLP